MGKKKIKKSIAKRFKVTKTGKVLFEHQYGSHKKLHKVEIQNQKTKRNRNLKGRFAQKN